MGNSAVVSHKLIRGDRNNSSGNRVLNPSWSAFKAAAEEKFLLVFLTESWDLSSPVSLNGRDCNGVVWIEYNVLGWCLLHFKLTKTAFSLLMSRWWAFCLGTELRWPAWSWKNICLNFYTGDCGEPLRSPLGSDFCRRSPQHGLIHVRKCLLLGKKWLWTAGPGPHLQYGNIF